MSTCRPGLFGDHPLFGRKHSKRVEALFRLKPGHIRRCWLGTNAAELDFTLRPRDAHYSGKNRTSQSMAASRRKVGACYLIFYPGRKTSGRSGGWSITFEVFRFCRLCIFGRIAMVLNFRFSGLLPQEGLVCNFRCNTPDGSNHVCCDCSHTAPTLYRGSKDPQEYLSTLPKELDPGASRGPPSGRTGCPGPTAVNITPGGHWKVR